MDLLTVQPQTKKKPSKNSFQPSPSVFETEKEGKINLLTVQNQSNKNLSKTSFQASSSVFEAEKEGKTDILNVQHQTKKSISKNSFQANPLSFETEKEKKQKIKKLSQTNKELVEVLKKQNDELTKMITRHKSKNNYNRPFSVSIVEQSPSKLHIDGPKKQLTNAYKQIQMYKIVLINMRANEISTESLDKIKMLENKIKMQENAIDEIHKQMGLLMNIKDQQQKELSVFENDTNKKIISELEEQLKHLKEKLKLGKRQALKRQQLEKKQHVYFVELEKLLRVQNNTYYPGKVQAKKDTHPSVKNSRVLKESEVIQTEVSDKQWKDARSQLKELKKIHQESNKKIEVLNRQKNKEIKMAQENQLKLKQKQKKLQQLKNKLSEVTKLVTIKQKKEKQLNEIQIGQHQNKVFDAKIKNSFNSSTTPQRDIKRWMNPNGTPAEKGKALADSFSFSDKTVLKDVQKAKIIEVHVWTDSQSNPCIIQFHYKCDKGTKYVGIQPYTESISHLDENIVEFKEGDYLNKIEGVMENGYLTSLKFTSKSGRKRNFVGNQSDDSNGQNKFKFEPKSNELPSCIFGAVAKNKDKQIRICHIGCEFISNNW